ncbi:MAG TPA: TonB-dependent receptor plug domain-containing protein, partial [Bacteroidia bacterium]
MSGKSNIPDTSSFSTQLDEFIVTGSRTEKKLDDIGRSVTVISKEEIKKSGANTMADILSQYEGIYITGTQQTFGANQSLFMRGANSNQSVILIDGVPINDPSTPNNAIDLAELSLSDIDHVEIVRGSHSTLYGSSAIGGVINIITEKKQKEGLNLNVSGTSGMFGKETSLLTENVGLNYTCKSGFYASANMYNMNVNGLDATIDTSSTHSVPRDKDGTNRFDYGGKLGFKNNRWDLHVNYQNIQTHSDIDKGAFTDGLNSTIDLTRQWLSYAASCKLDSGF